LIPFLVLVDSENSENALHAALPCSNLSTVSDFEYWQGFLLVESYCSGRKMFIRVKKIVLITSTLSFLIIKKKFKFTSHIR
jgi:hypothetical protein